MRGLIAQAKLSIDNGADTQTLRNIEVMLVEQAEQLDALIITMNRGDTPIAREIRQDIMLAAMAVSSIDRELVRRGVRRADPKG